MTPGFHVLSMQDYHRDPAPQPSLSSSIAKILLTESPYKAWYSHPKLNPDFREEHDRKFDLGSCSHAVFLEDDASRIVVVEADDWRTKVAKELRDQARMAGKTPLLARHYADVKNMVEVARKFVAASEIAEYWQAGESEVSALCQDRGVWLRCRFDRLTKAARFIGDYKSTTDASPEPFSRLLVRMGYHLQDAFYRRVARILGIQDPRFVFLAQSCEPPYECSLHACDPSLQEITDAEIERAIGLWRDCLQSRKWPSYGGRIHWAIPTNFQMKDHEQRLMEAA